MHLIVDAHQDLAHNMVSFGRDYLRSATETRCLEKGTDVVVHNGTTLLGWPEYQRGRVGIIFSTLFVSPTYKLLQPWETNVYADFAEANRLYRDQIDLYQRLVDEHPDKFTLLRTVHDLDLHLAKWQDAGEGQPPVGLIILMEGAEGIRSLDELEMWWSRGLRIIGPAWSRTRYCGGTFAPGPLTDAGRELLTVMADFNFTLDLSHMDAVAALQALDFYSGPVLVSHGNVAALLPDSGTNRHLPDEVLRGVIARDGVVGVVPFNRFLKNDWHLGDPREQVTLAHLVAHIDYICQMAGDAHHVGLGTDFDGGFGLEMAPVEIDTIADLQKLTPLLSVRGYTDQDIAAILGQNFIRHLKAHLPLS
ncbi:MAG: dipeptidase [Anaerolineales bacterium]|nr:dipeptidase [Anaerolineales bacterium]